VKSGATAISSEMLFGKDNDPKRDDNNGGRWSTPVSMTTLGERLQDHLMARNSFGSGGSTEEYKKAAKETADKLYEKGSYVAAGAYSKASMAKHAALDWITSMT